jgi:HPt (histidine-containing phosphotransfer) domain-containing protein
MPAATTGLNFKRASESGGAFVPVDLKHLRRYTLGDRALEKEVLQLFLDQLPRTIAALAEARSDREWKLAAHTLKGSGRGVGAWRIAAIAEDAERLTFGAPSETKSEAIALLTEAASEAEAFLRVQD